MLSPDEAVGKSAETQHFLEAEELDRQLEALRLEVDSKAEALDKQTQVSNSKLSVNYYRLFFLYFPTDVRAR